MAISGLVGAGAQDALAEMLQRQLLDRQQAEVERARQESEAMARERLSLDRQELQGRERYQQQTLDAQGQARREASNRAGVEDMLAQRGLMDKQAAQEAAGQRRSVLLDSIQQINPRAALVFDATGKVDEQALMSDAERKAAQDAEVSFAARKAGAVANAEGAAKAKYDPPKPPPAAGPSPYAQDRANRTIQAVDSLMGDVGLMTAGLGSLTAAIPGSPARTLQGKLDTLKANIAFNELSAMREASKTGGALGAVSERELTLLESALGSLDQGLAPDQLKAQLAQVKQSVQNWQRAQAQLAGGAPGPVQSAAPGQVPAAVSTTKFRFNPATGKVEPVQ